MTYEDFTNLNLTCRFYNTEKIGVIALSVPCYFASPNLNVISVEIKPYRLKQGKYVIQFVLNYQGEEVVSNINQLLTFQVVLNPQVFSVYPRNFIF